MTPLLAALSGTCDLSAYLWTLCGPADGGRVTIRDPQAPDNGSEPAWSGPIEPGGQLCVQGLPPGSYHVNIDGYSATTCGVLVDFDDVSIPGVLPSDLPLPGLPASRGDDVRLALRLERRVGRILGGRGVFGSCTVERDNPRDPKDRSWHVTVTHLSRRPGRWAVQQGSVCWQDDEAQGLQEVVTRSPGAPVLRSTRSLDRAAWGSLASAIAQDDLLRMPGREEKERGRELWVVLVHGSHPGFLFLRYLQPAEVEPWMRQIASG